MESVYSSAVTNVSVDASLDKIDYKLHNIFENFKNEQTQVNQLLHNIQQKTKIFEESHEKLIQLEKELQQEEEQLYELRLVNLLSFESSNNSKFMYSDI
jgi:ferritin